MTASTATKGATTPMFIDSPSGGLSAEAQADDRPVDGYGARRRQHERLGRLRVTAIAAPATTGRLYVGSEVGALRRVVLHRPDLELQRLTPTNKDELLFDDVLWVRRARQEHDAFADALRERGVEVLSSASCWPRRSPLDECARVRRRRDAARARPRSAARARSCAAGWPASTSSGWRRCSSAASPSTSCPSGPAAWPPPSTRRHWSSRRCPTTCSRATRRAGSTAA